MHKLWANVSAAILAEESSVFSARISTPPFCRVLPASGGTARGRATAQGDRHVVPGGEQLDILGHMAKREALIISDSIINTDVSQMLLIVGYFPMQ